MMYKTINYIKFCLNIIKSTVINNHCLAGKKDVTPPLQNHQTGDKNICFVWNLFVSILIFINTLSRLIAYATVLYNYFPPFRFVILCFLNYFNYSDS